MKSKQNPEIRDFILNRVQEHPAAVSAMTVREFGLSRTAVNKYFQRLVNEGWLHAEGNTKSRRYTLRKIASLAFRIPLSVNIDEGAVWQYRLLPSFTGVAQHVVDICHYGFTEIFNNAIDHSVSLDASVYMERTYADITLIVIDHGIGIFEKIQSTFHLSDPREALLELSKGKLTSFPERHAGEGIFFTSRMFEDFTIRSGELSYVRRRQNDDEWLIEIEDRARYRQGTAVRMRIPTDASWTQQDVFGQFQGKHVGFRKTHVPIKLARYENEQLVSRSQAKRILARFEKFSEILLDFTDIPTIGQAFADEIFRVFKRSHPDIEIVAIHASASVQQMIEHVQNG